MNLTLHLSYTGCTFELEEQQLDLRMHQFEIFFNLVNSKLILIVSHSAVQRIDIVSVRSIEEIIPTEMLIVFREILRETDCGMFRNTQLVTNRLN